MKYLKEVFKCPMEVIQHVKHELLTTYQLLCLITIIINSF